MSGGSLDNLYSKDNVGSDDLWKLEKVKSILEKYGLNTTQLYKDITKICEHLTTAKNIILNMKDTLHDAEWYISGDYDEDEFLAAVKKYNANPE